MFHIFNGLRVLTIPVMSVLLVSAVPVLAKDFPYRQTVSLKVGQSVILKGVRNQCSKDKAPSWGSLTKMPKLKTGVLTDGGTGTMISKTCNGRVAARAIKFKATKPGSEKVNIYKDAFRITVK